ncbi:ATP-binding protein [Luteithermobacter gelatinilyticus]|uniref:ATP-binding protein n=1 Tax=Luteithermobacter gelatinilyticus TaxID=2582913 RepID=UPI00110583B0|nr:ATP-binding protein [Luteithermobacter gelatinilyticus]
MTILIISHKDLKAQPILAALNSQNMAHHVVNTLEAAMAYLKQNKTSAEPPHNQDKAVILSDRMFLDQGQTLSQALQKDPQLHDIPIIVAVNDSCSDHLLHERYQNSVYWFHQPFREIALLSTLKSALADYRKRQELRREIKSRDNIFGFIKSGIFRIKTFEQAEKLATMLSLACPEPDRIALGLLELLINSIEHGNLGIGFEEKRELIQNGRLKSEIKRRLALPENRDKFVEVAFDLGDDLATFRITDHGEGFDVDKFFQRPLENNILPSGRGIALARSASFDYMEYLGNGNMVLAVVYFKT